MSSVDNYYDLSDDETYEVYEDALGWRLDFEGNYYCHGCDTGTDCVYAHCTVYNDSKC